MVHRLGRPDGPQPRPPGRGGRPGRGPRGPGAAGHDHRRHARRRPPVVAAPAGRDAGSGPRSLDGPRRARSTRSRCSRRIALDAGPASRTSRVDPAPAPARWIRAHDRHASRPVEVELKYRVVDLAGRRALPRRAERSARSPAPAGALDADRGPLRRHGRRRPRAGRASRSACAQSGTAARSSRSSRSRRREGAGGAVAARGARGAGDPGGRTAGLAGVRCPLARARARRRRAARRARDDPPAPPQAAVARRRHPGRAQPRRGRRRRRASASSTGSSSSRPSS